MSGKVFCALTCSLLSLCGFLFLFVVGILVKLQPEYMKISKSVESPVSIFESACLYGTIFVASSVVYFKETRKRPRKEYDLSGSTAAERQNLLDK
ncbi:hypothetical protein PsorP6_013203 [Peronosclerospora sorghi]|uniref:Uncharacterized protein n=1 Tax=Peronosclerospora sorghi TaxID=230839 RepID=A0ACC0WGN5_9STRA|nr:hypothetical protein PsorP6_013203 [Peronosclerospora sorghi]